MEDKMEKKKESSTKNMETRDLSSNTSTTKAGTPNTGPKARYIDRVSLRPEVLARVEHWISQVEDRCKAIRITRNELVNFILLHHAPGLSEEETQLLGEAHYDEVRFAAWALKSIREARSRGETLTLNDLMKKQRIPE